MFAVIETPRGWIVIDNYGLPCSWPVSRETAERLAASLNALVRPPVIR